MNAAANSAAMTPAKALLVLLGIIVVIGAFIALNHALGIGEFWCAFLFLLYWSGNEQSKLERLPHCVAGALFGLALAYALLLLSSRMGAAGGLVFLAIVLVVIYCQIMGWFTGVVNMMAMLFLTVGTISAVQQHSDFPEMFAALALGVVYFGVLVWAFSRLQMRSAQRAAA